MDWLQKTLVGSRDGCFLDPGALKVDASIVCHEIRFPDLEKGETVSFSVKDVKVRDREKVVSCGEAIDMKGLRLDSLLLVRAWAGRSTAERVIGEVRIPIDWLISRCNSCLYYTWVLLEDPGLDVSVTSVGLLAARNDGDAFDQALRNGPRLLSSPGACLSIIKTDQLPPTRQIMWTDEMDKESRSIFWPSLLKSQQQHMMMCQAQKCQRQTNNDQMPALQEELKVYKTSCVIPHLLLRERRQTFRLNRRD